MARGLSRKARSRGRHHGRFVPVQPLLQITLIRLMDAGPSSAVAAQRIRGVFLSASLVCSPFSLVRPEHRWKTYNS